MGPYGSVPPIKISAGSFLPDTLPSALYPARHQPFPSFRGLQAVPNFAGNTYKHRANECRMELAPIMPSAADVQPS